MATDGKILIDGLVTRATSINTTLIAALTVVATLLLLKLAKKQEFSLYGVTLKTDWAPYIMMVFTLFHFYFEKLFVTGVKNLINQNEELAIVAWSKLSDNGPLFFNGLVSRLTLEETQLGQVFVMKSDDPTSWLTHGVAIATFAALVKLKDSTWLGCIWSIMLVTVVIVTNWLIGSQWAVYASCLQNVSVCRNLSLLTL